MKIKKRTGQEEEFSVKKSHDSMVKAGATDLTASSIANGIKTHPGITTSEVRKEVIKELHKQAPRAARHFEEYKKKSSIIYL